LEEEIMSETKGQDAIALLKDDHRAVEKLFSDFEAAKGEGRKQTLARRICLELTVHTKIEEEIFYPACEGKIEEDLIKEAYVEHDAAKVLIAEIEAGDGKEDDFFDAKVQVLSEQIEHHVEEEEKKLFPEVRRADVDLDAVGQRLASRKRELMKQFKADGVPEPELTTMDEVSI
jgi:hemerythrin superfamily protein